MGRAVVVLLGGGVDADRVGGAAASRGRDAWPVTASDRRSNDGCPSRQVARTLPSSSARASERTWRRQSTSSRVMAAPLTVLATISRMYCKTPNSEDLQRTQLLGKTTPKVSTPLLSTTLLILRTETFAVQYT